MSKLFTIAEILAVNAPIAEARGLPPRAFFDPTIYEAERQHVFFDGWCAVAFADRLRDSGVVMAFTFLDAPLLLVRQADNSVKLFHDLVPYDAAPLRFDADRDILVGTYHGLEFGLDGKLIAAPFWDGHKDASRAAVDSNEFDLIEIPCAQWGSIIFANIAGNDPDGFARFVAPLDRALHWLDATRIAPALRDDGTVMHWQATAAGNWKTHHENACMNVYHENSVHEIYRASPSIPRVSNGERDYREINDGGLRGLAYSDAQAGDTYFPLPLPDLPRRGDSDRENVIVSLYPNLYYSVIGPHCHATIVSPVGPEQVELQSINYFAEDSAIVENAALAAMIDAGWMQAVEEDGRIIEAVQNGRRSPAAQPNHYAPFWDAGHHSFNQQILADLGESA